jgi:hypothetical protein
MKDPKITIEEQDPQRVLARGLSKKRPEAEWLCDPSHHPAPGHPVANPPQPDYDSCSTPWL